MTSHRPAARLVPAALVAGALLLLLGAALVGWTAADARHSAPRPVEMALPSAPAEAPGGPGRLRSDLLEDGPYGPMPRTAPDGRRPLSVHARPFAADARPKVAILLVGLGLQDRLTARAVELPGEISLQFSGYARALDAWLERARDAGHEVLLDLPMEPMDYPADDPGPHLLLADADATENLDRLARLLARGTGYVGLAGRGGRFAGSTQAPIVLGEIARRGLGLVELGADRLAATAETLDLAYLAMPAPIDAEPSATAIDRSLAALEAAARAQGGALGFAQAYPVSLERLEMWTSTLEARGLVLAPVSAFLIHEPAALSGQGDHAGRASRFRG